MSAKQLGKRLYYIPKITRWTNGIGAELPEAYKKFWKEWKIQEPTPVHYIKQEGKYVRNEKTEVVHPVQNIPIPLTYPKEINEGIWGGEAVVQGFQKKRDKLRRFPHFWFPSLKKTVVYSEVLGKYMSVVVTNRTINLIHEHYGFDHYLLKTPACDLRSELALKLKRKMLLTLLHESSKMEHEIYSKYKDYLNAYTPEEIEWYGLTYKEACIKHIKIKESLNPVLPLKIKYRSELIAKLEENVKQDKEAKNEEEASINMSSWISKLNPFTK